MRAIRWSRRLAMVRSLREDFDRDLTEALLDEGAARLTNHSVPLEVIHRGLVEATGLFDHSCDAKTVASMDSAPFLGLRGYARPQNEAHQSFTCGGARRHHPLFACTLPDWWPLAKRDGRVALSASMYQVAHVALESICRHLEVPLADLYNAREPSDSFLRYLKYERDETASASLLAESDSCCPGYLAVRWCPSSSLALEGNDGQWQRLTLAKDELLLTVGTALERRFDCLRDSHPSISRILRGKSLRARRQHVFTSFTDSPWALVFSLVPGPDQVIEYGRTMADHLHDALVKQSLAAEPADAG